MRATRALPSVVTVATVATVVLVLAAGTARAEPGCEPAFTFSLLDVHYEVAPAADDRLGLDLVGRGLDVGWGGGCDDNRHRLTASEVDASDFGRPATTVVRFASYRHAWYGPGWTFHLGLRGVVLWGDDLRFATPVVGGSARLGGDVLARAELDLGGLALLSGDVRRGVATDLTLDASLVWPDHAATRGELHARLRDLGFDQEVRTVTVSAGVGMAYAARDRTRAIPAFVGLSARVAGDPALLATVAWSLGVTGR